MERVSGIVTQSMGVAAFVALLFVGAGSVEPKYAVVRVLVVTFESAFAIGCVLALCRWLISLREPKFDYALMPKGDGTFERVTFHYDREADTWRPLPTAVPAPPKARDIAVLRWRLRRR